jgi:hypothetical protein
MITVAYRRRTTRLDGPWGARTPVAVLDIADDDAAPFVEGVDEPPACEADARMRQTRLVDVCDEHRTS